MKIILSLILTVLYFSSANASNKPNIFDSFNTAASAPKKLPQPQEIDSKKRKTESLDFNFQTPNFSLIDSQIREYEAKKELENREGFHEHNSVVVSEDSSKSSSPKHPLPDAEDIAEDFKLYSDGEHINFLRSSIHNAENNILITSWKINVLDIKKSGVERDLIAARNRGVHVSLYFKELITLSSECLTAQDKLSQAMKKRLNRIANQWVFIDNHSKIFRVDNSSLAIGSWNWLSPTDKFDGQNATVVLRGLDFTEANSEADKCIEWYKQASKSLDLKSIRNLNGLKYCIRRCVHSEDERRMVDTSDVFDDFLILSEGGQNTYLSLNVDELLEHISFSICCAKSRVVICSPFVSVNNLNWKSEDVRDLDTFYNWKQINHILNTADAERALSNNVQFVLVTNKTEASNALARYFKKHKVYRKYIGQFIFMTQPNVHQKTILIDQCTMVEGSFNFFSGASSMMSTHNNLEVSVAQFDPTGKLASDFYGTDIGKAILDHVENTEL